MLSSPTKPTIQTLSVSEKWHRLQIEGTGDIKHLLDAAEVIGIMLLRPPRSHAFRREITIPTLVLAKWFKSYRSMVNANNIKHLF
jgi:hypothetical protein